MHNSPHQVLIIATRKRNPWLEKGAEFHLTRCYIMHTATCAQKWALNRATHECSQRTRVLTDVIRLLQLHSEIWTGREKATFQIWSIEGKILQTRVQNKCEQRTSVRTAQRTSVSNARVQVCATHGCEQRTSVINALTKVYNARV